MAPVQIGDTGWTVQDWDKQWPAVFCYDKRELTLEPNGTDAYIEFDEGNPYRYNHVSCMIPHEVLAEYLRRNGYEVKKNP